MTDRQADATCFRLLIEELETASASSDPSARLKALTKNQRLWSMIMKANSLDAGATNYEDRELFVRLASQAQRYGIRAILDTNLSLAPLIGIAETVLEGLEASAGSGQEFDTNAML
jgi:cell division FtsZ-interacting protein ZapD